METTPILDRARIPGDPVSFLMEGSCAPSSDFDPRLWEDLVLQTSTELTALARLAIAVQAWLDDHPGGVPEVEFHRALRANLPPLDRDVFDHAWEESGTLQAVNLAENALAIHSSAKDDYSSVFWRALVPELARELRFLADPPGGETRVGPGLRPSSATAALDLTFGYLRGVVSLDAVRKAAGVRHARREAVAALAGLLDGPEDLADRHDEYLAESSYSIRPGRLNVVSSWIRRWTRIRPRE